MYEKKRRCRKCDCYAAPLVILVCPLLLFFFYLKSIGAISLRDRLQVRNSWAVPSETKE